jgi:hypothetical protein
MIAGAREGAGRNLTVSSAGPAKAPRGAGPPSLLASRATAATHTTADTPDTSARLLALACAPWPRGSCSTRQVSQGRRRKKRARS